MCLFKITNDRRLTDFYYKHTLLPDVTIVSIFQWIFRGRFLPPALSLELTDLYLKLFKPLKVNKKHFTELTREARIVRLDPGEAYAVEEVTPADERLSILLKGKYVQQILSSVPFRVYFL